MRKNTARKSTPNSVRATSQPARRPLVVWIVLAVACLGIGWLAMTALDGRRQASAKRPSSVDQPTDPAAAKLPGMSAAQFEALRLPPFRPTKYVNAGPDARFIGNEACVACHADEHASYLRTPHSQALGPIDLAAEPPAEPFTHARSKTDYEVVRQGDELRHRLVLRDDSGAEALRCEEPIRYHIGSGNHSRSYLVEHDGFLLESPITWYASRKVWALSPGYDLPVPMGFDRMADQGCLVCHAGRVEAKQSQRFQVSILEGTIGCESCHGPGSLHAEYRRQSPTDKVAEDLTIVNPARAPREVSESVCSYCHLRGAATVTVRGRNLTDFRPGMLLSDIRIDYQEEQRDAKMKVVGHVDQMRQSACYIQSGTMTCVTCHNPHDRPDAERRMTVFRAKCVACHEENCGLDRAARTARHPDDNCMACHMPESGTDIPHFAFTHHRIGIHSTDESPPTATHAPRLAPMMDVTHLPAADQKRNLGLAYLEYSEKQTSDAAWGETRALANELLAEAHELGAVDALTLSSLAGLALEQRRVDEARELARAALREADPATGAPENALYILANAHLQAGAVDDAARALSELVTRRRVAADWVLLAIVRNRQRDYDGAWEAVSQAAQINPMRPDVQGLLAEAYANRGQASRAAEHQKLERLLRERAAK